MKLCILNVLETTLSDANAIQNAIQNKMRVERENKSK